MLLYHGTDIFKAENIIKNGVNVKAGRRYLDFGQGFYLTPSLKQAVNWSIRTNAPCVLEFDFNCKELNIKHFPSANREWAEFVIKNRLGMQTEQYDVVYGPMADTGVSFVRKNYQAHKTTFEQAVNRIIYRSDGSQVVVLREKAVKALTFIRKVDVEHV